MFDSILVPLDGSLLAECVLSHAIAMGQAFNTKIVLLHVLDKKHAEDSAQLFDLLNWQINKTEAKQYLDRISAQLQNAGLQTTSIVLEGPVAETITDFAQSQEIKLIILSSHGQSGVSKWGISSIAHKILLSAPASVLIVRAPWLNQQLYKRILVPLDGSWRAENVLPIVTQLAHFHKSQIQIVHIVKTPEMARHMPPAQEDINLSNRIVERNQEEAQHYFEQVQLRSPLTGNNIQSHLLVSSNVNVTLHELVDREQIDMMIVSAHGYSEDNQRPYGSLVNNFILYGKVPLLIVQDIPIKEDTSSLDIRTRESIEH